MKKFVLLFTLMFVMALAVSAHASCLLQSTTIDRRPSIS